MVEVREATIEDAAGIVRVRAESWRGAYRGIVSDEFLDAIDVAEWAERQRRNMEAAPLGLISCVAIVQGEVVGWAACGRNSEADTPYAGELYTIYLLPTHWRRGIGRLLMAATAQSLMCRGMSSMILWVLAENWPARRFYEALGGQHHRERQTDIAGSPLPEVSYGWLDLEGLANNG